MALGRDGAAVAPEEPAAAPERPRDAVARGARGRLLRVVDAPSQPPCRTSRRKFEFHTRGHGRRKTPKPGPDKRSSRRSSGAAASILKQKPTTNAGSRRAGAAPPVHPMIVTRPTTTAPSPFGETRRTSAGRRSRASSTRSSRRGLYLQTICGPSPCCSPTTSASTSPWATRTRDDRW